MPPFSEPYTILPNFKEKIDSLTVQGKCVQVGLLLAQHIYMILPSGDRLFLGTSTGNLHIYNVDIEENGRYHASLVRTKSLGKKSIENVGYIKDINSVVALSGMYLHLARSFVI